MKRSKNINTQWISLCAATITAMAAGGCGTVGPESDYTSICEDQYHVRLEDKRCEQGTPDYDSGSLIMFIPTSSDYHVPAVGQKVDQSKFVRSVPSGKTVQKAGIPPQGSVVKSSPNIKTITRGGFGVGGGSKGSSGG